MVLSRMTKELLYDVSIDPFMYGALVVLVFFGTVLGFQFAGVWSVSGKITASGDAVQPSASDVNTIKGWMTLEQIASAYNAPVEELLKQFDLPADTSSATAIKDLESEEFSVTNLRSWLSNRVASEPATEQDVVIVDAVPEEAVPTPTATALAPAATPQPEEHTPADKTITGKTTFGELLDWGVTRESIEKILGEGIPASSMVIKDFANQKGIAFSGIKASLQAEVDQTK